MRELNVCTTVAWRGTRGNAPRDCVREVGEVVGLQRDLVRRVADHDL